MSTPLLPQAFWFRLAIPCRRIDGSASDRPRGGCSTSPSRVALPDLARLEGGRSWAEVRVAWNPGGLAVAVEADGQVGADRLRRAARRSPTGSRSGSTRATRATSTGPPGSATGSPPAVRRAVRGPALDVELAQRPIARAVADAPTCRIETLSARAERLADGLAARALPPRRGAARLRPRDQPPARLRLPGLRPRPRGPVPGRRPRVPHRRGPEPLVDPGTPRAVIRLA